MTSTPPRSSPSENDDNKKVAAFHAYLDPLLRKHAAGQALVYEDLASSYQAALAVGGDAWKQVIQRTLHFPQTKAYLQAAQRELLAQTVGGTPEVVRAAVVDSGWKLTPAVQESLVKKITTKQKQQQQQQLKFSAAKAAAAKEQQQQDAAAEEQEAAGAIEEGEENGAGDDEDSKDEGETMEEGEEDGDVEGDDDDEGAEEEESKADAAAILRRKLLAKKQAKKTKPIKKGTTAKRGRGARRGGRAASAASATPIAPALARPALARSGTRSFHTVHPSPQQQKKATQMKSKKGSSSSRYQRQFGGGSVKKKNQNNSSNNNNNNKSWSTTSAVDQQRRQRQLEAVENSMGVEHFIRDSQAGPMSRRGWLYNMIRTQVTINDTETSALDLFFVDEAGGTFRTTLAHRPYFYVIPRDNNIDDGDSDVWLPALQSAVQRLMDSDTVSVQIEKRVDLDAPNHLSPRNLDRPVLKIQAATVTELQGCRMTIQQLMSRPNNNNNNNNNSENLLSRLVDMREYDVPYTVRVCTDLDIRAGTWYTVHLGDDATDVRFTDPDRERVASPTVLAFDIECTKAPLKFPQQETDEIFMISYMVNGVGYLITSGSVVPEKVPDFAYTPAPQYPGPFTILHEANELALLQRFFTEYRRHRPHIVVTYNGDFFDWPFVEARAKKYGMDLFTETSVQSNDNATGAAYLGRVSVHLDAFHWVQRDSYLPQGAQGLKAVTRYKLGYDPVEVDPEDMVRMARERPVHMATYSVSDAVATYYLYDKYVHLFIFSLCTIISMAPEDVLRKGSGTLCETLLMSQATNKKIIYPNKQKMSSNKFHEGHLLESETYIGGKVECLETGVYRSDVEYDFDLKASAFQELIDNIDRDLTFAIEVEGGKKKSDYVNYDEIRAEIIKELEQLRDRPKRVEKPYIYHLDVGAMYPNIILSNRLQPSAIVDDAVCATCDFNQSKNNCKRRMKWVWRGDYNPATRVEYERTKDQLSRETTKEGQAFHELDEKEQAGMVATRLKEYSRRAYKKTKVTEESTRTDIVCMRENDFYVETVRSFRDRRYEYKALKKTWGKKSSQATDAATKKECEDKVLVYDSLQVAHKCILNSFYGYVMRKGARWRSMEMAGIVTKNGADIITQARKLVEQIGRPLELDTDGIWCILPNSFPDVYSFQSVDGSKLKLEYPCVMLNAACHDEFTNHQYQTLVDADRGTYKTHSECSIFFEVDGPYRCMVLPASTEEGKLLKKRYAVFNFDGSLAELKGFELKRRGELELIKTFQSQVFERFLDGDSLEDCYASVAEIANHWIDVIDTRGESLDDDELIDLISENRNMSRQLDDYGDQKGTSQTTARRLGDLLGAELIKDKGLNCKFIIAEQPYGAPVTERAIPTVIWKTDPSIMRSFLRKWLKSPGLDGDSLDIRNILDWDYYLDRLGKTIQKIITIPAALQKVDNPVPRIKHPAWLESKIHQLNDRFRQKSITDMFARKPIMDIEDQASGAQISKQPIVHKRSRVRTAAAPVDPPKKEELSKENFEPWLKNKKASWKKARQERKTTNRSLGLGRKPKAARSMEGFIRDASESLAQREWQIIEARELSAFDTTSSGNKSGEFALWVVVGHEEHRKITLSLPRTVFVSANREIQSTSGDILGFRKVEKFLPYGKSTKFLYEVTMEEFVFRKGDWMECLQPAHESSNPERALDQVFEVGYPSLSRVLSMLGSIVRMNSSAPVSAKSYTVSDLVKVDKPSDGEYFSKGLTYRRSFLYVRLHPTNRTGVVAVFLLGGGSGGFRADDNSPDLTRPSQAGTGEFDLGASCFFWIVKAGAKRKEHRNVSVKDCEGMCEQLVSAITGMDSDYSCVSPNSLLEVSAVKFVENEDVALAESNSLLSRKSAQSVVLLNSNKTKNRLRRQMTVFNVAPVVTMPFPPGPAHNPELNSLPALNWESPAVQLSLEAYVYMTVVSFPKRISYSRYGQVPLGNLEQDENVAIFDTSLSRLLEKNRALSWANGFGGKPDVGQDFAALAESGIAMTTASEGVVSFTAEDIWEDDDQLVSPVIRRPGAYRTICVDIDLQDLAVAALAEASSAIGAHDTNPSSPSSVAFFPDASGMNKLGGPLGNEMSTSVSLPVVKALVVAWLKDAFATKSMVADELLHHIYRLLSSPDTLHYDPALHRVMHGLMKSTFQRVVAELSRLGCNIIFASFHRIIVGTNKIELADAEEYINFVLSTAKKGTALSHVTLQPRQFHSHFVFLDEFNFGTLQLERVLADSVQEGAHEWVQPETDCTETVVVPSVVTGWSLTNYLGSEIGQEYFRILMGRFSKDVWRKQMDLLRQDDTVALSLATGQDERIVEYKKTLIMKHFASYLTRAVDEILKDDDENDAVLPPILTSNNKVAPNPALEFIKNVIAVLELDTSVTNEVQGLKRSLLAQLDIPEYSQAAMWSNPCPQLILPDLFCSECQDSRDVNLCYVPPPDVDDDDRAAATPEWTCSDCGSPYDITVVERRLLHRCQIVVARYQLQDLRHRKTKRVVTRVLEGGGVLDTLAPKEEVTLMHSLAELHGLDHLRATTEGILNNFR